MSLKSRVHGQIQASLETKQRLYNNGAVVDAIVDACDILVQTYRDDNKLLIAGNGGSAADAQHIAAELVGRFAFDRAGLPALALTTDTSILTAVSNDYGYDAIFARQLEANARPGDVFVAITTSGNSTNIIAACEACRPLGVRCIGLTGESGGALSGVSDPCIKVPATDTARIQECHILIGHIFCDAIEQAMFG